jgi:hypothetical protein
MRTRGKLLVSAALGVLACAGLAGPAGADIILSGKPDAPETTCAGSYDNGEAVCTFPAIGGRTFVVGGSGSGAFWVTLEVAGDVPGAPPRVLAHCDGLGAHGCVGGQGYNTVPVPAGATLTCRVFGAGTGSYECSSFRVEE